MAAIWRTISVLKMQRTFIFKSDIIGVKILEPLIASLYSASCLFMKSYKVKLDNNPIILVLVLSQSVLAIGA